MSVTLALTTQSSISTTPTAIYIISGYGNSGATTETITGTFQSIQSTSIGSTPSVTTSSNTNGMYIITSLSLAATTGFTTTTTTLTTPSICNNGTHYTLTNGTCVSRETVIANAVGTLNSNSSNSTQKADALITYITAITNSSIPLNANNSLTIAQIDGSLAGLSGSSYNVSTDNAVILITQPKCGDKITVIGASVNMGSSPNVIDTANYNSIINSNFSAAGVLNFTGQCAVKQFNMFIINDPTIYQTTANSINGTLASPIVTATIDTNDSVPVNTLIKLYFQDVTGPKSTDNGTYSCAFYDTKSLRWNESGCSMNGYNTQLDRYECSCNHLTSFALIWLPKQPSNGKPAEYNAQDKASIAFQAISIVCLLGIVTHIITVRILYPQKYHQTTHLLPIMSCGVTIILFIFYIALGLTVYTRLIKSATNIATTAPRGKILGENSYGRDAEIGLSSRAADQSSSNSPTSSTYCLPSEQGLMFVVYFLIIFMFCTKTAIGIDNYRRYVRLFPPLSYRNLIVMMGLSLLFSVIWLAVGAGLNSNPANGITEVYAGKLCWFSRRVNNYFLTIPVCLFLAINLAMFIPVIKHNVTHVHAANEDVDYCVLRKRCIYILLVSGGTQGFGWLFGPVISLASPAGAEVLGWFFIIFNGLEGLWALLLYIIVEKEGLDRSKRHAEYLAQEPDRNDNDKDDHGDQQEFQLDEITLENRYDPLTNARSDSPRNSFAKLPGEQVFRRSNRAHNEDRPT